MTRDIDHREAFRAALEDNSVSDAARAILDGDNEVSLEQMLELAWALCAACGADASAGVLRAELSGYQQAGVEIPDARRATGFASAFPVKALDLGLLDPEEIFLNNREKFSQVTLTIGQPIAELEAALAQIKQGGVLALNVPASEIIGDSAITEPDTEVFIYILPREIERIVEAARMSAISAIVQRIVEAAVV